MRYLLTIFSMALTACQGALPPNPKFHYGDLVEITGPYYTGCKGSVEGRDAEYFLFVERLEYTIKSKCSRDKEFDVPVEDVRISVLESHLTLIKSAKEPKK